MIRANIDDSIFGGINFAKMTRVGICAIDWYTISVTVEVHTTNITGSKPNVCPKTNERVPSYPKIFIIIANKTRNLVSKLFKKLLYIAVLKSSATYPTVVNMATYILENPATLS